MTQSDHKAKTDEVERLAELRALIRVGIEEFDSGRSVDGEEVFAGILSELASRSVSSDNHGADE